MIRPFVLAGILCISMPALSAAGELELGLYGGMNENFDSYGELSNGTNVDGRDFSWRGLSFEAPIYYGVRLTFWPDSIANWGFAIDYTHAKAYADLTQPGVSDSYSVLEFTDGLNLLTANALYKHDWDNGLRAYGGLGVGVSIPHVEVTTKPSTVVGASETFEYQVAGPAVQAIAGGSYEFADNWRLFSEYKLSYTANETQLAGGVGTFSTNITSQHLLAGISYSFDAGGF